jgi:hypothetical protein
LHGYPTKRVLITGRNRSQDPVVFPNGLRLEEKRTGFMVDRRTQHGLDARPLGRDSKCLGTIHPLALMLLSTGGAL